MSDEEFAGFGDDLDDIIPDTIVDDTYLCKLTNKIFTGKNGRKWWALDFTIEDEGPYYHEVIREMYWLFSRAEYETADVEEQVKMRDGVNGRKRRNARLESLGVPRSKFNEVSPEDLDGNMYMVTVTVRPKTNGTGYNVFIQNVEPANSVADGLGSFADGI